MSIEKSRKRGKNKISFPDIILSASALLISLSALFVSISQVRLMQKQMHLSVMPRIDISFSSNSQEIIISITNSGLGPAEILATKIEYDSIPVNSWDELFLLMNREKTAVENFTASKLKNRMLVSQQIFPIFTSNGKNNFELIEANKEKIKITLFYKSLYDDYFEVCRENMSVSSSITNNKVSYCSFSEKESFQR